jgi:thiamine kinase-like enzyme
MHEMFLGRVDPAWDHLLRYDAGFHRLWMERAVAFARDPGTTWEPAARERVEWLAARWEPVAERLTALPATFIHGEFYPSNVLVGRADSQPRICPIDWEMAAAGPGLVDLAALTGGWPASDRAAIAAEYQDASGPAAEQPGGFEAALEACRLHLAVRWLGWEPTWSPPPEHRQDWLAEAVRAARALGLE